MEECNICLNKIKERNKNNYERSKKHSFFSNLIFNKYIIKNDEVDKFDDILQSCFDEHQQKLNQFSIDVIWEKNDVIIINISVPCTITYIQKHMFKPIVEEKPFYVNVSSNEFQKKMDRGCE